jgi:hypothetical protein
MVSLADAPGTTKALRWVSLAQHRLRPKGLEVWMGTAMAQLTVTLWLFNINGGFNGKIIYKWTIFHGYIK